MYILFSLDRITVVDLCGCMRIHPSFLKKDYFKSTEILGKMRVFAIYVSMRWEFKEEDYPFITTFSFLSFSFFPFKNIVAFLLRISN